MSAKLSAGTFSVTDLYGFWLPLYQFICACVSVLVGQTFYTSKLISAVFGVGVCLLVYDTSLRLTSHRTASLLAFALIALSPLHIFNSTSAMTDVPHACFVLAGVACVLRKRWILAAIFVALAGLTRMDSWILIALIPALQFLEERRVSLLASFILMFPPVFWFYLSWKATGNWLDNFVARKQYMDWLLSANPSLASFSLSGIARDAGSLLLSTDLTVMVACFVGIRLAVKRMVRSEVERNSETLRAVVAVNSFFFAFLGFIVLAYLTHKQPIIFPRYGLLLFALGIPILPWTLLTIRQSRPQWARRLFISTVVVCVLNAGIQLAYSVYYINKYERGAIAVYLRS
ncbi:MAG TPA: glycosyltransferase family 39 protein [Pyrinomonadaceae bacterium]